MQFWKLNEENAWKDTIINDGKMSDVLRGSFLHPNGFRRHLQPTLFWAYTAIYQKKISHEKSFSSSLHNTTCAIVMVRIKSYSEKMGVFPGTTVPHSTNNIREAKKLEQSFECLNRLKQREFHFHLFIVIPLKGNQGWAANSWYIKIFNT